MPFEMDLNSLLEMAKSYGRLQEAEKRWGAERTSMLNEIAHLKEENARLREEITDYEEDAREQRKEKAACAKF